MASSFTVNGSNTTINFSWTAPTTTIINIVGNAAELLYNRGINNNGADFSTLTNSQKLTIVEEYFKRSVIDIANANKLEKAEAITRATEEVNKFNL